MTESTKFVSYDLLKSGQNYDDLYALLKSFPVHHKITESFWMVNTSLTPKDLRAKLLTCLDDNDRIFVINYASGSNSAWHNPIEEFKSDLVREDL